MATGAGFTALTPALKRRYDDKRLSHVGWSKGVLAAMVAKKAWDGEMAAYMLRVGNSPARSATYSVAASKSEDATYGFTRVKQAQLPWVKDYGRATIEGLLMRAAGSKMGSVYDKFVAQIDGIMDATMHSFSTKVYRDGFGRLSTIHADTTLASTTLKLGRPEDVYLFEVGQGIVFSESNAGHVLRDSGEVLIVTGINHNAGTLTTSANVSTIAAVAAGDSIFAEGDRQNSATPTRLAVAGLDAWLPSAAPSGGEAFFNLGDRNTDGRLLGVIVDATTTGMSQEECIIKAVTETSRRGGKPRHYFTNPTNYEELIKQGQARYRPARVEGPAKIGFDGVVVESSNGNVNVFPDLYCPVERSFLLELDSWCTYLCGSETKLPGFLDHDGNNILRQTSDDGVEARVGYYAAFGGNAPCHNAVVKHV